MSRTSCGGTVLMPISALVSGWPSAPMMLPGSTVSVIAARCASVRLGAEFWSTPTVVGALSLTSEKIVVCTRGR